MGDPQAREGKPRDHHQTMTQPHLHSRFCHMCEMMEGGESPININGDDINKMNRKPRYKGKCQTQVQRCGRSPLKVKEACQHETTYDKSKETELISHLDYCDSLLIDLPSFNISAFLDTLHKAATFLRSDYVTMSKIYIATKRKEKILS